MTDESKTYWVQLKGEDLEHIELMKQGEKRSYSSMIRRALDYYWKNEFMTLDFSMEEMTG